MSLKGPYFKELKAQDYHETAVIKNRRDAMRSVQLVPDSSRKKVVATTPSNQDGRQKPSIKRRLIMRHEPSNIVINESGKQPLQNQKEDGGQHDLDGPNAHYNTQNDQATKTMSILVKSPRMQSSMVRRQASAINTSPYKYSFPSKLELSKPLRSSLRFKADSNFEQPSKLDTTHRVEVESSRDKRSK